MSALSTPDVSRTSSLDHSLTVAHEAVSKPNPSSFPDAEKSWFFTPGSSSFSLQNDPIYFEFADNDPRNPVTYSRFEKWCITLVVCGFTGVTATASSSFAIGTESMMGDLHCTQFQATVAFCVYPLGFALAPLFSTAFSEEVGRRPIYLVTAFASVLCYALAAMSNTIRLVIVARALGGAFASTGATLVGGTDCRYLGTSRVLFFCGASLRRRSPLCSKVVSPEESAENDAHANNVPSSA